MQPFQSRQERRAAERRRKKLERKMNRSVAIAAPQDEAAIQDEPATIRPSHPSPVPVPALSVTEARIAIPPTEHGFSPELESEFSIESLNRARSIYDHFESKAAARRSASHKEHQPQAAISPVLEISEKCETVPQVAEPVAPGHKNKSTGPRTPAGKLASSGNSLKHGLAAPRLIIPGEDPSAFDALLADLLAEHQPASSTEELLVREMAQSWWLTQRALRFQNDCFTAEGVDQKRLALFLRYQTTHERAFHKSLSTLIQLKKDRAREFVSQSSTNARIVPPFVSQNGFVSQNQTEASRADQFASQNGALATAGDQFVSQNDVPEKQFEAIAA